MARKKSYGRLYGPKTGLWVPVAASLKVHPQGGMWVFLDSNGRVTLSLDGSAGIFGWAIFPISFAPGSTDDVNGYWTSNSTEGADKVWVYTNPNTVFAMPVVSAKVWAQARLGETIDITGVNTADGTPQEADPEVTSTDVLLVAGGDDDITSIIYVRMNESKIQKDGA